MAQSQTTHEQDHLALAREYIAIAESQDAKREAYQKAADEIVEAQKTMGYRAIATAVGKSDHWVKTLVQWRTSGTPGSTPFANKDRMAKGAAAETRKVLAEQPRSVAPDIAKAMEDPEVREEVAKHMMPGAARDLSERANRDHPARRKLDDSLGVPESKVSYEIRMSGPLVRIHDAISYFVETHEHYSESASDEELESVRDQLAGELARAQAAIADWSMR